MRNNIRRMLECVLVLTLILAMITVSLADTKFDKELFKATSLTTQANVGYGIYTLFDGNEKDDYITTGASLGAAGGAAAGVALTGGTAALAAAKTGAKIGAISGGLVGAIVGAGIGAL